MLDNGWLQNKLQKMVATFPWYDQLLSSDDFNAATPLTSDHLKTLPLLTSELLEQFYYCPEQPFAACTDLTSYRTSGTSSGSRKTIFYSAEDEQHYLAIKTALFGQILQGSGVQSVLSDMGTGHAASTAVEVFRSMGLTVESLSYEQPIEQHLALIQAFKPHVLYTMPSLLDRLFAESADSLSSSGIRKVILVGEIASPSWINSVAERLAIKREAITDTYGSIEIGTIAYFSHKVGRYLFVEGIVAEGINLEALTGESDADVTPLAGDESILVLTSLTRDLFPALRYVTYDVVRDLRPVQVDGQWKMSFKGIVRRIGTELKHGEKISLYDIEDVVFQHLKDAHIRVQSQANKLTILIDSEVQDSAVYSRIENELLERIPEIGCMIRGRMLEELRVLPASITYDSNTIKHKRIIYD